MLTPSGKLVPSVVRASTLAVKVAFVEDLLHEDPRFVGLAAKAALVEVLQLARGFGTSAELQLS